MPNMTMGPPIIASLRKHSQAFFDCHLMVSHPKQWVQVRAAWCLKCKDSSGGGKPVAHPKQWVQESAGSAMRVLYDSSGECLWTAVGGGLAPGIGRVHAIAAC